MTTRRTSSTHRSSKVIHPGLWSILLGFVSSQNARDLQLRILSSSANLTLHARGRGEANSQRPRIPRPLLPQCKPPQLTSLSQHRSCGRRNRILIPANIQHKRTETEHECGDQERQPKPDVSLCIDHGDGTRQSTDVNHAVEVHEDTRDGLAWVDDHAFAGFGEGSDVGTRFFILFCD